MIPFDYDGEDPLIKSKGNFRVFKHANNGSVNYSLAISINDKNNDKNEEFFSELEQRIARTRAKPRNLSHQILSQLRLLPMASTRMCVPGSTRAVVER